MGVHNSSGMISAKLQIYSKQKDRCPSIFLFRILDVKIGYLERVKKYDKPLFVWTVNQEENMQKLFRDSRVQGIITEKLKVALEIKKIWCNNLWKNLANYI